MSSNGLTLHKQSKSRNTICKKAIRHLDLYAQPITLTYKGDSTFKTSYGGVVSLFVVVLLTAMAIYKSRDMFLKIVIYISINLQFNMGSLV